MTERSPDPARLSPAALLFADWIQGSHLEGTDFEALCRAHPEHAAELRGWLQRLLELAGRLGRAPEAQSFDAGPPSSQLLGRLAEHSLKSPRYTIQGELARGGMGAILKVFDEDLRRTLAMKVILGKGEATPSGQTPPIDRRLLARFLEEAQVTGQLDHPGIVPVHELGLDAEGRVFFTMKLVKGRDLKSIFELVFEGREDWNETRALSVLLKVCEAVAYAHKKGVIHRDLKPANVMVGSFGEVYVMDWGLARVLGRDDTHDMRLKPEAVSSSLRTERKAEREEAPDSPLFTMDGDVVGTPCYMPPEQARGEVERLGPRSDVYAIGSMLYHLLARQMPYVPPGARFSNRTVLARVVEGPPQPLHVLRKDVPAELEAICDKAMERNLEHRYLDTLELAEDLRAYLEGRVVRAHRTGAMAELSKWVRRNRGLAASMAAALLALMVGLGASLVLKAQSDRNAKLAAEREVLAEDRRKEAEDSKALADNSAKDARWAAYVSSIRAADAALRLNEPANLRRALDRAPEEFRNWEWHHLNALSDSSLLVLRGHELPVSAAIYSPDGTRILTVSEDTTARLWDAASGLELASLLGKAPVRSAAFSADGSRIMTVEWRTVRIWETDTRTEVAAIRAQGHASLSPDGSRAITFHGPVWSIDKKAVDNTVRVWDTTTEAELAVLRGHDGAVVAAVFSPDGSRIVSCSRDGTARIWDAANGAELAVLAGHEGEVRTAAFSTDGSRIVSGSGATARVWSAATGAELAVLSGHEASVRNVAFSPDGSRIVTLYSDHNGRLWDAANGAQLAELKDLTSAVGPDIAFSPDGSRFVTINDDKAARVWDTTRGAEVAVLRGHAGPIKTVTFSPDGSRILTASNDGTSRLWDSNPSDLSVLPAPTHLLLDQEPWSIESATFSPDGSRIAIGHADGTACILDLATGEALVALRGHGAVEALSYSPDGSKIATGHHGRIVRLWDAATGTEVAELRGHEGPLIACVAFSTDGERVVTAQGQLFSGETVDKSARLWDAETGAALAVLQGHEDLVTCVAFSPNGSRIATGSSDQTARIWDSSSAEELAVLRGNEASVKAVSFSPDGSRIATASGNSRLWDSATGQELAILRAGDIGDVIFSPDGSRVVTASYDGTARFWDAATGVELAVLRGHEDSLSATAFSPDGARIITASDDGTTRIWDAIRGDELAVLRGSMACFSGDGTRILTIVHEAARVWDSVPWRTRHLEQQEEETLEPEARRVLASIEATCANLVEAAARIRGDANLDPIVRRLALDFLTREAGEASGWVRALRDELPFPEEVCARVESTVGRGSAVKKHALFLARALEVDPSLLNTFAWEIVRAPDRSLDDYARALRAIEVASAQQPQWALVNTLGVAQYRNGLYMEALATLARSIELSKKSPDDQPDPSDLAFVAMAQFRLGETGAATPSLEKLRELMLDADNAPDQDNQAFLREAEALLDAEGKAAGK